MGNTIELLSVDAALFGTDDMDKPIPEEGVDCLIFDGSSYHHGTVTGVDLNTKTYKARLTMTGLTAFNNHICRFRPIS